jgi:tetratricopeptide (TPR) repeat protein
MWCTCGAARLVQAQARQGETFQQIAEKAKRASEENRLDDAVRLYGKALTMRPRWEEGWWSLGTIQYDQDKYAEAAKSFARAIAIRPGNGTAHAMLGLCQYELGDDESALKNLMTAESLGIVKNDQLRKVAVFHLGVVELRTKRFNTAKETLWQLAKDGIRTNELILALGQASLLVRPQDSPGAGTEGLRVLDGVGDAEARLAAKDFEGAKKTYAELEQQYPAYPNLHLAYGRFLLELHETDEAVAEFQKELKRDPNNVNCLLEIAAVRYQVDSQEGLRYASEAVELAPQIPFAHYLLGMLRLDTGDAAEAIPELEIAHKGLPNEAKIYFALGNAYARVGRKVEAARARAEFARLNALEAKKSNTTVHGEQPSGLSGEELRTLDKEKPLP